jgi:phage repressor protein C with HTH and peptisase S24 domain
MSIGERLKKAMEKAGSTAYKLNKATKISQSTIGRILKDENIPNRTTLLMISENLKVNIDWLELGIGEMNAFDNQMEAIMVDYNQMNVMFVPLVSTYAQAGYLSGFNDPEYIEELPKVPFADDKEHRGEYLCFEVKGDSMEDGTTESILEGDLLLCRNVKQDFWKSKLHINKWDFVIVHKEKGILVKRIIHHDVDSGIVTLHSLNDYYEDFKIHLKDVAKILNVVDIKRKHKRR